MNYSAISVFSPIRFNRINFAFYFNYLIFSERFAVDEEYRKEEFQTTPEDRPLVAHFSGASYCST